MLEWWFMDFISLLKHKLINFLNYNFILIMLVHACIDFLLSMFQLGRTTFYLLWIGCIANPEHCVFEYLSSNVFCLLLLVIPLMLSDSFPSSNKGNEDAFIICEKKKKKLECIITFHLLCSTSKTYTNKFSLLWFYFDNVSSCMHWFLIEHISIRKGNILSSLNWLYCRSRMMCLSVYNFNILLAIILLVL